MITKEQIVDIYKAAHIALDISQAEELARKFDALIEFNRVLMEVDTLDLEPMERNTENRMVLREDVPVEGLDRDAVLERAAKREYGYFKLQKVLD